MDVQHQLAKRPRSLSEDSPGREGKISAQASDLKTPALLLLTNGDPENSDQATCRRSSRFQSGSIPPPHWPPSVEGIPTYSGCSDLSAPRGFSRVPTSKNAICLPKSLSCDPPPRSRRLDLHGSLGPHAVPLHNWAKVVANTRSAGSSVLPPDYLLADPTNAWSPVSSHNRRERKRRVGTGPVVAPSTLAYRQATLQGLPDKHLQSDLLVHIQTDAYTPSQVQGHSLYGRDGSEGPSGSGGLATSSVQSLAPLAAAPSSSVRNASLLPLPTTGIGFRCPSRRCQDKPPYTKSCGYLQHLNNQQHSTEEAQSFRIPAQLPEIVKCRTCGQFCTNTKGLKMHKTCHRSSVVPPLAGQLPPTTPHLPSPLSQFRMIYLRRLTRCLQRSSWTCSNGCFMTFNGPGALPFFVLFSG